MNTLTQTTPEAASALRNLAIGQLQWCLNHAVTTFNEVPDDKLDFKISETAMSPREMVVHLLSGHGHVGRVLGIDADLTEGATDRESLIARLTESTGRLTSKMESLSAADMDTSPEFFGRQIPMPTFLMLPSWHVGRHAGQIDFLQTTWGDMENHF